MDNVVVLYESKYGATEKYASWISEELACTKIRTKHAHSLNLSSYDTIIIAGGVYAGKLNGFTFLKKNYELIKDKTVIALAVGISPYSEKTMATIKDINLKGTLSNIPCFYCPGTWDISKMSLPDKIGCKIMSAIVRAKSRDTKESLEDGVSIGNDEKYDLTSKDNLKPLFEYINKYVKGIVD